MRTMTHKSRGGWALIGVTFALAVGATAFAAQRDTALPDVEGPDDAASYARGIAPLFIADGVSADAFPVAVFEVDAQAAQNALRDGLGVETPTLVGADHDILVVIIQGRKGDFRAPRPRHGYAAELPGDALVLFIDRETGLDVRAVVPIADAQRWVADRIPILQSTLGG